MENVKILNTLTLVKVGNTERYGNTNIQTSTTVSDYLFFCPFATYKLYEVMSFTYFPLPRKRKIETSIMEVTLQRIFNLSFPLILT